MNSTSFTNHKNTQFWLCTQHKSWPHTYLYPLPHIQPSSINCAIVSTVRTQTINANQHPILSSSFSLSLSLICKCIICASPYACHLSPDLFHFINRVLVRIVLLFLSFAMTTTTAKHEEVCMSALCPTAAYFRLTFSNLFFLHSHTVLLPPLPPLCLTQVYQVPCPVGQSTCECPFSAEVCEFNLTVNNLQTFSSYSVRDDGTVDRIQGYVYIINESGQVMESSILVFFVYVHKAQELCA